MMIIGEGDGTESDAHGSPPNCMMTPSSIPAMALVGGATICPRQGQMDAAASIPMPAALSKTISRAVSALATIETIEK